MIDHQANHHSELERDEYLNIQSILDNYDDIKDLSDGGQLKLAFVKKIGKSYAVVVELSKEDGKIVLHKSFFYRDKTGKRIPYKNKPSIFEKWSVDGSTTISPAKKQPADTDNISALDHGAKVGISSESSDKKSENVGVNGNKKANAVRNGGVAVDNVQGGASVNKAGARPAQGAATTTGAGLVRTHERTSLQSDAAQDKQSSSKEQGKSENVGEGEDNSVKEAAAQQLPTERRGNVAADYVEGPQEHSGEMRPLKSANDDKLSITSLPPSTTILVTEIDGESSVSVKDAIRAIDHLPGSVDTLDGYHLNISRTTRNKLKNEISKHKNDTAVLTAMSHIEEIVGKSLLIEEHRDRMKIDGVRKSDNPSDQNIEKTQRFYGAATIDGVPYRVKSTAIVSRNIAVR